MIVCKSCVAVGVWKYLSVNVFIVMSDLITHTNPSNERDMKEISTQS